MTTPEDAARAGRAGRRLAQEYADSQPGSGVQLTAQEAADRAMGRPDVLCPFATDMACPANPPCPTPHQRACLGDDDQDVVPGPWLVGVFCDHPDCPADHRADYLARTRADAIAALRSDLNDRGWLCDPAADYCPEHRP